MISGVKSPRVLPLEFSFRLRPVGRLVLLGQVPTLAPLRALPLDAFLWIRWVDAPVGSSIDVVASMSPDEVAANARVIARAALTNPRGARALYRVAEVQGVGDLFLADSGAPAGAREPFLHLLASVAPSQRSAHSDPVSGLSTLNGRARSSSPPAQTPLAA